MSYYKEIVVNIRIEGYQTGEPNEKPVVYAKRAVRCPFLDFSNTFVGVAENALYSAVREIRDAELYEELEPYIDKYRHDRDKMYILRDAIRGIEKQIEEEAKNE